MTFAEPLSYRWPAVLGIAFLFIACSGKMPIRQTPDQSIAFKGASDDANKTTSDAAKRLIPEPLQYEPIDVPPPTDSPVEGKIWALLVGINDYQEGATNDLNYAVRDARLFANLLRNMTPEHQVWDMTDDSEEELKPTRKNIMRILGELRRAVQPEDTLIFFFSGHGISSDDKHYL
ncbi:MAG: caspase family protein, partial [Candidatus Poribacteria bacterium]|nr:caspase family protein [Candidatus Poribacteria bacterium]